MDLGLPDGIVKLTSFNPAWSKSFAEEKERLDQAVGPQVVEIQHIGSTSIPGMRAKPILDIGIAVVDFEAAKGCIDPIMGLGYKYLGEYGIPRRHFFSPGQPEDTPYSHVGNYQLRMALAFAVQMLFEGSSGLCPGVCAVEI